MIEGRVLDLDAVVIDGDLGGIAGVAHQPAEAGERQRLPGIGLGHVGEIRRGHEQRGGFVEPVVFPFLEVRRIGEERGQLLDGRLHRCIQIGGQIAGSIQFAVDVDQHHLAKRRGVRVVQKGVRRHERTRSVIRRVAPQNVGQLVAVRRVAGRVKREEEIRKRAQSVKQQPPVLVRRILLPREGQREGDWLLARAQVPNVLQGLVRDLDRALAEVRVK